MKHLFVMRASPHTFQFEHHAANRESDSLLVRIVLIPLDKDGPVLGLLPDAQYQAATLDVSPGDLLMMYSDGLVEATNAES
jgi:serine phosphatase RsbU (regulator of sigma subunit)